MTTARLVFVNHKFYEEAFKSFDIPFALITKEKFKQPIFGSNYIEGLVKPLHGLLPGDSQFYLYFKKGGCQSFLRFFA